MKNSFMKLKKRDGLGLDIYIYLSMLFLIFVTLYPFAHVIAVSFNNAIDTTKGGIGILPRDFTTYNYEFVLKDAAIINAAIISVARTLIGTIIPLAAMFVLSFLLAQNFVWRKFLTILLVMTIYIDGGIIPRYWLYKNLNLTNSFMVYIIPAIVFAFHVFILRSYLKSLPDSFSEAARLEGAGEFTVMWKILMPLCQPVLVVIGLFLAVQQWNMWIDTYLFASSNKGISTLQYELYKVMSSAQISTGGTSGASGVSGAEVKTVTPAALRATMTVIVTLPMALIYPFLQGFFRKGLSIGGIKE